MSKQDLSSLYGTLHELELQLQVRKPKSVQEEDYSSLNLFEEGFRIIRTIDEVTEDSVEFGAKTRQAYQDGMLLMTLEALREGSADEKKAQVMVQKLLHSHSMEMIALFEDLTQEELEQLLKRPDKATELLHSLSDKFHSLSLDSESDLDFACQEESYLYALWFCHKKHPKLNFDLEELVTSEHNFSAAQRICEFFYKDCPVNPHLMFGQSGDVAFRIGMCYYQGLCLPLDHVKSLYWLAYAATLGYPQARLAYNLCFGYISLLYGEAFSDYLNKLKGIYLLCKAIEEGRIPFMEVDLNYTHEGASRNFRVDMLCNITFMLLKSLSQTQDDFDDESGGDYTFIVEDLVREAKDSTQYKVRAALALLFFSSSELMMDYIKFVMLKYKLFEDVQHLTIRKMLTQLLQPGLEAHDYYSLLVCNTTKIFPSKDGRSLRYLKDLAKLGEARSAFNYGGYLWGKRNMSEKDRAESFRFWQMAADKGLGAAQFNLMINDAELGRLKDCVNHASLALDSGVMVSFYSLYKIYADIDNELACTYLRYAASYLFPMAQEELSELKRKGKYQPLPFMKTLDEIAKLGKDYAPAALLMSSVYFSSGLMPHDPYEVMYWLRQAALLGDTESVKSLNEFYYGNSLGNFDSFYLRPLVSTLQENLNFLGNLGRRELDEKSERLEHLKEQKLTALLAKCYKELELGKSELEHELFIQSIKHDFWEGLESKDGIPKLLKKTHQHNYYYGLELWLRAMTGNEEQADFEDFQSILYSKSRLEHLIEALQIANITSSETRASAAGARAVLSVRSATLPMNLENFYTEVEIGDNGNELFCTYMDMQNYDVLSHIRLGFDALHAVEHEHVFIAGVSQ